MCAAAILIHLSCVCCCDKMQYVSQLSNFYNKFIDFLQSCERALHFDKMTSTRRASLKITPYSCCGPYGTPSQHMIANLIGHSQDAPNARDADQCCRQDDVL